MNTITKRIGIFGAAGAAASALIVGGLVAPAQASTLDDARTTGATSAASRFSTGPVDLIDGLLNGGLSGNSATGFGASGNDTSVAPLLDRSLTSDIGDVASGNAVGNGNNAVVGSGNDTSVSAPVTAPVSGTVSPTVNAPVDGADVGSNVGDIGDIGASVNDLVDNTLGDSLDLGAVLGR